MMHTRGNRPQIQVDFHFPPGVKWIMIVTAGVYVLDLISINLGWLWHVHLALTPGVMLEGGLWNPLQLGTYMLLHSPVDPMHLVWNMLGLWFFGPRLESRWGTKGFVRFYILCGVFAGVAVVLAVLVGLSGVAAVVGASGAVLAVITAIGVIYPEQVIYLLIFPVKAKYLVLGYLAINVLYALSPAATGQSTAAHLGGIAAGFILTKGLWRPRIALAWFRAHWLRYRMKRAGVEVLRGGRRQDDWVN